MEQVVFTQVPIADLKEFIANAVKEGLNAHVTKPEEAPKEDPLLTRKEAARYLRLSPVTLNEHKRKGLVRFHRIGGRVLYRRSDLDRCLSTVVNPKHRAA